MYTFLVLLFVLTCFGLIVAILLQAGKGQGLAGTFGGVAGGAVFGGRGAATFLSKSTTILTVVYLLLCISIGLVYKSNTDEAQRSLMQQQSEQESSLPATDIPVAPIPEQPTQQPE